MKTLLGWICWNIVMRWPENWPMPHILRMWVLAWAGAYAFGEPKSCEDSGFPHNT